MTQKEKNSLNLDLKFHFFNVYYIEVTYSYLCRKTAVFSFPTSSLMP